MKMSDIWKHRGGRKEHIADVGFSVQVWQGARDSAFDEGAINISRVLASRRLYVAMKRYPDPLEDPKNGTP